MTLQRTTTITDEDSNRGDHYLIRMTRNKLSYGIYNL